MSFIIANSGQTVYIDEVAGVINYSIDSGPSTPLLWPVTIGNNDLVDYLKISFRTNITLDVSVDQYFICTTEYIQFGDVSLRLNGERAKITVNNIPDYPGLIKNGESTPLQGYANVRILNLAVLSTGSTTLKRGAGWIGQEYYAHGAINNTIVNCFSDGAIGDDCGGIVGWYAGSTFDPGFSQFGASFSIIGCSSTGDISNNGGGIAGSFFCTSTTSTFSTCSISDSFSTGLIADGGGGITGYVSGTSDTASTLTAMISNCYSTGEISDTAGGGIVGDQPFSILVEKSYSIGNIKGGGIAGFAAGNVSTTPTVRNSYSTGNISVDGGGIFGINIDTYARAENCYTSGASSVIPFGGIFAGSSSDTEDGAANNHGVNNYAEANHGNLGAWNTTNANTVLLGIPSVSAPVGSVWAIEPVTPPGPYILSSFGHTPYSVNNIDSTSMTLVKTYSQAITIGASTPSALITIGHTFYILAINGSPPSNYPTITINAVTGAITAATGTAVGIYGIVVYDKINPYTTTEVLLTVSFTPIPVPSICCIPSSAYKGLTATDIATYRIGNRLLVERNTNPTMRFPSYEFYIKYKMALTKSRR